MTLRPAAFFSSLKKAVCCSFLGAVGRAPWAGAVRDHAGAAFDHATSPERLFFLTLALVPDPADGDAWPPAAAGAAGAVPAAVVASGVPARRSLAAAARLFAVALADAVFGAPRSPQQGRGAAPGPALSFAAVRRPRGCARVAAADVDAAARAAAGDDARAGWPHVLSSGRFLSFDASGGGLNNDRRALQSAAALARLLNRTLVLPPPKCYAQHRAGRCRMRGLSHYYALGRGAPPLPHGVGFCDRNNSSGLGQAHEVEQAHLVQQPAYRPVTLPRSRDIHIYVSKFEALRPDSDIKLTAILILRFCDRDDSGGLGQAHALAGAILVPERAHRPATLHNYRNIRVYVPKTRCYSRIQAAEF